MGTLEFFPEEGKYHFDGHRKCGIRWHPQTSIAHGDRCTVCGKPVTVGVMHRVEELADRPEGARPEQTHPFRSIIPLPEILAEVEGSVRGQNGCRRRMWSCWASWAMSCIFCSMRRWQRSKRRGFVAGRGCSPHAR
ncbi:MAG: hypothetical protein R2867_16530 [Caldilineaceae bacterium]